MLYKSVSLCYNSNKGDEGMAKRIPFTDQQREEIEKAMKVVKEVMEHALELSVPLVTEARLGSNWGELEKVDEEPVVIDLEE